MGRKALEIMGIESDESKTIVDKVRTLDRQQLDQQITQAREAKSRLEAVDAITPNPLTK